MWCLCCKVDVCLAACEYFLCCWATRLVVQLFVVPEYNATHNSTVSAFLSKGDVANVWEGFKAEV